MLGQFLKINGSTIPNPNPGTYTETYTPDENVYKTEAGTQMSSVIRLNRLTWAGEFNVSSRLKTDLLQYAQQASVECKINGVTKNGRLRVSGPIALYANSAHTAGTDGLWVMSLVFEEF